MYDCLLSRGARCVYHFTDNSNIQSIRANGGLYSLTQLSERGICDVCYGGNDWSHNADHIKDVAKYVHLSFTFFE